MAAGFKVRDISLAAEGRSQIEWAEAHMPVLMAIRRRFEKEKPLAGLRIAACMHVTKETAVLMRTLKAGGAEVALCPSNPLSTQDSVAAALVGDGIKVFAWRGVSSEEFYWCIERALDTRPHVTMDDGADLVTTLHTRRTELIPEIIAGQEETTTGVIRLRAMAKDGALKFPVFAINDTPTKRLFDNRFGSGQSTIDGILRATAVMLAGKNFVVAGFGHCGRGVAEKARGMGAKVIIVEVNPVRCLEAAMEGYQVMTMDQAAAIGDIFVTVTGDKNVIREEHFMLMKDGAILCNSGHFNVEIEIPALEKMSVGKKAIRSNVEQYELPDGRRLYLLAEGRLVNLAAAEGHPCEVMDMSFANQALISEYIAKNAAAIKSSIRVHDVPAEIDNSIALMKLEAMGLSIEKLTKEQEKYLNDWREGT